MDLNSTGSLTSDNTSLTMNEFNKTDIMISELNLSNPIDLYEIFIPESVAFHRYVTPFIWAVGFPGNILSFLVWIQRRMRHSSGCYLAALAMDDFVFLCLHVIYELHQVWKFKPLDYPVICQGYPILFLASQYLSPLLVLGFTVERYISICHPFKREKFCTTKRAKIVVTCLAILSLSMSSVQGYFYNIDANSTECGPRPEVQESGTISFLILWNTCAELFIFLLVPLNVLILNILVIRELRRLSRVERCELHGRSQRTQATTVMLLAVSFYQIFTTLPVSIVYALFFEFPAGDYNVMVSEIMKDPVWKRYFTYTFVQFVIQEIGITHYAFNIIIYIVTGKMFRKELKRLLCHAFCFKLAQRIPEYTSLRSSARSSLRIPTLWVSVNGHTEKDKGETTV